MSIHAHRIPENAITPIIERTGKENERNRVREKEKRECSGRDTPILIAANNCLLTFFGTFIATIYFLLFDIKSIPRQFLFRLSENHCHFHICKLPDHPQIHQVCFWLVISQYILTGFFNIFPFSKKRLVPFSFSYCEKLYKQSS